MDWTAGYRALDSGREKEDLLEVHDEEVDPLKIMADIRAQISRRRGEAGYPSHDSDLLQSLERVNEICEQTGVSLETADTPAMRIPLFGRLWATLRRQAHALVIFYVNRGAARQTEINRELVGIINRLAARSQVQERQLEALREEVARLRSRDER